MNALKPNNYFFELALTAVLMVGALKYAMTSFSISSFVDLTIVAAVIFGFSLIRIGHWDLRLSDGHKWYGMLVIFFLWATLSLAWSTSSVYAQIKLLGLVLVGIVALTGISNGRFDVDRLFRYILYVSFGGSIVYLFETAIYDSVPNYFAIKDSYLFLGKFLGFATLTIAFRGKDYWGWSGRQVEYAVFAMVLIILALGARGALFFTCLILFVHWIIEIKRGRVTITIRWARSIINKILLTGFVLYLLFMLSARVGIQPIQTIFVRAMDRFHLLYDYVVINGMENPGSSIGLRYKYWEFVVLHQVSDLKSFFIGSGIGSFATVYSGLDVERYPHNIFLEIWFELGLVGLMIFGLVFWNAAKQIRTKSHNTILGFLVFYEMLHLMKSHSLSDLRLLALLLSLCFANHLFNAPEVSRIEGK